MAKIPFLLLAQLILSISSVAQSISTKQIGLGTGFAYSALKSEMISSYAHTGTFMPLQLFFGSDAERNKHHIQLQYAPLTLSSLGGMSTAEQKGYLQYAYHRKLGVIKNRLKFYGGIVFDFKGSRRGSSFSGYQNIAGEEIASLSPSILMEMIVGKDIVTVQCWSSVLAYLAVNDRLDSGWPQIEYIFRYSPKTKWMSSNEFLTMDSRISYNKYLTPRLNARLDYQFQFYKLSKYETILSLSQQAIVSLVYKISK
jgi:hypothetical protein